VFLDTLLRYGNVFQSDKSEARGGLFGAIEIATVHPALPTEVTELSDIERLNKERDLVGIYLSAHPLDEYAIIIDNVCNTRLSELADLNSLRDRSEITFAGMVTDISVGTTKDGSPCGFVKIEDFRESFQLRLYGSKWVGVRHLFNLNEAIFVRAKITQRFKWNPNSLDLSIESVDLLNEAKDTLLEKITLTIELSNLTAAMAGDLTTLFAKAKGNTSLDLSIVEENKPPLDLHSDRKIKLTKEVTNYLRGHKDVIDIKVN
jgi:DNA polymerase III subunit alpha